MSLSGSSPFKLFRNNETIWMGLPEREALKGDFPRHSVHDLGKCALDLLRRRETQYYLSRSAAVVSPAAALRHITKNRKPSSLNGLRVTPTRLQFGNPDDSGTRPLYLIVEDETGLIQEEREIFLRSLSQISDVPITPRIFVPKIEIGRAPEQPDINLLAPLSVLIPDTVNLSPVRVYPQRRTVWVSRKSTKR